MTVRCQKVNEKFTVSHEITDNLVNAITFVLPLIFQRKAIRCVNKKFVEKIERGEREHLKISGRMFNEQFSFYFKANE